MKGPLLLVVAVFMSRCAFAFPLPKEPTGHKVNPPRCDLPKGLKPAPDIGPDFVRCGLCPSGQGVKANGYCGQCAKDETLYGNRCCPAGASMTGGKCVTDADKKAEAARAKALQACLERCAHLDGPTAPFGQGLRQHECRKGCGQAQ